MNPTLKYARERRGATTALMAILLPVMLVIGSMAINVAYIELTRSELMVATDAAARAGGRAMSYYQDIELAKEAAQATAALNTVAGEALRLSTFEEQNEIEFGDCVPSESTNRYEFQELPTSMITSGEQSANAVRVNSALADVPMLFPTMNGLNTFDAQIRAVAMQVDRDICLVLDRSGSMSWTSYNWPPGVSPWSYTSMNAGVANGYLTYSHGYYYYASGQNSTSYQNWLYEDHYNLGSAPQSPWDQLVAAVDTFLSVLEETDQQELVSLATYSTYATLDLTLQSDYNVVRETLNDLSASGMTAIGRGLETGVPTLLDATARPFAAKTIILMTDGIHNTGDTPESIAEDIVSAYDVIIHTVTFGSGADIARMQEVADIGGGTHFHAANGDEFVDVFEEIANNLPTIVTQ